jgi:hypothetical protein
VSGGYALAFSGLLFLALLAAPARAAVGRTADQPVEPECFVETGFCIATPEFRAYFAVRGGARILGFPVSRDFVLEGFRVQFFQRAVLQLQGTAVARLNLLDPGVLPVRSANESRIPEPDAALALAAPRPDAVDYARQVAEFVHAVAPDTFEGLPVGFARLYDSTVPVDLAFPNGSPDPALVTLLNLEIWGLPTSRPAFDPRNADFVYQRFQRGIMHFRRSCQCTDGILVGDYLKSVLTGRDVPADLAGDVRSSRYFGQYQPGQPGAVARPLDLPNSDLTNAFEVGTGAAAIRTPTPPVVPVLPSATPTPGPREARETKGSIIGRVTVRDSAGVAQPVAGAQVVLFDMPKFSATTGPDGRYELASLPVAEHLIYMRMQDSSNASDWATSDVRPITIIGSETPVVIDFDLRAYARGTDFRRPTILDGVVQGPDGNLAGNVTVWRLDEPALATSAEDGSFHLVNGFLNAYLASGDEPANKITVVARYDNRWGYVQSPLPDPLVIRLSHIFDGPPPPVTLYEFDRCASEAIWSDGTAGPGGSMSGAAPLLWSDMLLDLQRGYVTRWESTLRDGTKSSHVVETHPRRVNNGEIRGLFAPTNPNSTCSRALQTRHGDFFVARVGLLPGNALTGAMPPLTPTPVPGGEVTYRVQFVPLTGAPVDLGSTSEGSKVALVRPLPPGMAGRVSLIVNAGRYSAGDRAAWIEPLVVRIQ